MLHETCQKKALTEKLTVSTLREVAKQFDFYAGQHLAKTPPDIAKAETNQIWAERCRAAIPAEDTQPDDTAKALARIFKLMWDGEMGRIPDKIVAGFVSTDLCVRASNGFLSLTETGRAALRLGDGG